MNGLEIQLRISFWRTTCFNLYFDYLFEISLRVSNTKYHTAIHAQEFETLTYLFKIVGFEQRINICTYTYRFHVGYCYQRAGCEGFKVYKMLLCSYPHSTKIRLRWLAFDATLWQPGEAIDWHHWWTNENDGRPLLRHDGVGIELAQNTLITTAVHWHEQHFELGNNYIRH